MYAFLLLQWLSAEIKKCFKTCGKPLCTKCAQMFRPLFSFVYIYIFVVDTCTIPSHILISCVWSLSPSLKCANTNNLMRASLSTNWLWLTVSASVWVCTQVCLQDSRNMQKLCDYLKNRCQNVGLNQQLSAWFKAITKASKIIFLNFYSS